MKKRDDVIWTEEPEPVIRDGQAYTVRHMTSPNCIATVYKPILSPEEYARRHKLLEDAVRNLFLAQERQRAKEEEEKRKEVSS